jgi:putative polymerase
MNDSTLRFHDRPVPVQLVQAQAPVDRWVLGLTLLAVTYNALLAFINAHVFAVNFGLVAVTEIMILGMCLVKLMRDGIKQDCANILWYCGASLIIAMAISLMNGVLFVDAFRNALIITLFLCLGRNIQFATLRKTFLVVSVLVLGVMLIEMTSLLTYAQIFKPAVYFLNTRGMPEFELDDTGIFRNALGFAGRFSFGIFAGPRTSSLFLEQVSLANFAAVLCVFLLACWPRLSFRERVVHVALAALIILSNNTRTTSILFVLSIVGYFVYPRLPRYLNVLVAPLIIVAGVTIYTMYPHYINDDFAGRVSHTGRIISNMGFPEYLGMQISQLSVLMDAGYPYVIYSSSFIGFIMFWLMVSFVIPQRTPAQMRCAYGLTIYIFVNLLIGGTAIFSIKVAALLWLLVGFISSPERFAEERPAATQPRQQARSRA